MDCSLPGSSVRGISQARILEWVAISFSRGSSQPRDWTWVFFTAGRFFTFWATREAQKLIQHYKSIIPQYKIEFKKLYIFHHSFLLYFKKFSFMNNCSVQFSSVVQSCLTLCDPMDNSLLGFSVHGIFQARVLEWVAISFSRGSSRLGDQTQVSSIVGRRFNLWATREAKQREQICPSFSFLIYSAPC